MDYSKYHYTVLCEDVRQFHFVRGWLEGKGVNSRRVTQKGTFPHKGSGKAYVKEHFQETLTKHYKEVASTSKILIVVIDADNEDVDQVYRFFKIEKNDYVFIVIPKWSIETWIQFVADNTIVYNETKSLKNEKIKEYSSPKKMGMQLVNKLQNNCENIPPSLKFTYDTIKKQKQNLGLSS